MAKKEEKAWVLPDIDVTYNPVANRETFLEKLTRKTKEDPLIYFGLFGTVCMLSGGLYQFLEGNAKKSNLFMQGRIAAQGTVVAALVFGAYRKNAKQQADIEKYEQESSAKP